MNKKEGFIIATCLIIFSLIVRYFLYPITTPDYVYFLSKWFTALSEPGLSAFKDAFANYAPLYLYILKFLTELSFNSLYSIKSVSVLFDILLALLVFFIYRLYPTSYGDNKIPFGRFLLIFAIVFSLPTVILNSSLWGQSDSIYTAFVLISLYGILVDLPIIATLGIAFALCFKLQAAFFLPIFIGYLLRYKEYLSYILLIPIIYLGTIIPAWLAGGSFSYWAKIYLTQGEEYKSLSLSSPSIFAFIQPLNLSEGVIDLLFWIGLGLGALLSLIFITLSARAYKSSKERMILLGLLCVLIIPYLLPRMHERYFYLADIFSLLYAIQKPKHWPVPFTIISASLLSYLPYLSQVPFLSMFSTLDLRIPSAMLFFAIIALLREFWRLPENSDNLNHSSSTMRMSDTKSTETLETSEQKLSRL